MRNIFTIIKTLKEEEIFYGITDSFGNSYEMLSVSKAEVENLIGLLNSAGDVDPVHTEDMIQDYFYDLIER